MGFVTRGQAMTQAHMDELAALANSKAGFFGKPFVFMPPTWVVANATERARAVGQAQWEGGRAIIVERDTLNAYQVTTQGGWQDRDDIDVLPVGTAPGSFPAAPFGSLIFVPNAYVIGSHTQGRYWVRVENSSGILAWQEVGQVTYTTPFGNFNGGGPAASWRGELNRLYWRALIGNAAVPNRGWKRSSYPSSERFTYLHNTLNDALLCSGPFSATTGGQGITGKPPPPLIFGKVSAIGVTSIETSYRLTFPNQSNTHCITAKESNGRKIECGPRVLTPVEGVLSGSAYFSGSATGTVPDVTENDLNFQSSDDSLITTKDFQFEITGSPPFETKVYKYLVKFNGPVSGDKELRMSIVVPAGWPLTASNSISALGKTNDHPDSEDVKFNVPGASGSPVRVIDVTSTTGIASTRDAVGTAEFPSDGIQGLFISEFGNAAEEPYPGYVWTGELVVLASPSPTVWLAQPIRPNANILCLEAPTQRQPAGGVSDAIGPKVRRIPFHQEPGTSDQGHIGLGGIVRELVVSRKPGADGDKRILIESQSAVSVRIGYVHQSGAFVELTMVNIPAGQLSVGPLYPQWIFLTQTALTYEATSEGLEVEVDIQAMFANRVLANSGLAATGKNFLTDGPIRAGGVGQPLMIAASHYNDCVALLEGLPDA